MANIKSQIKRNKQNEKARRSATRPSRPASRPAVRKFHEAVASGDKDNAVTPGRDAAKKLDKAASKGVIHKNQGREPQVVDREAVRRSLIFTHLRPVALRRGARAFRGTSPLLPCLPAVTQPHFPRLECGYLTPTSESRRGHACRG
ncbi:30S ribosomal protein S20 [Nocardioides sp. B-3]|uniref:30S ribosomal protein S20 n=1 Tax=Nocardioides sp. B-3 TaxID=2895565 RepID=UPI003FA5DAE5